MIGWSFVSAGSGIERFVLSSMRGGGSAGNILTGSYSAPVDCIAGVRILDKSTVSEGGKMASDPMFNLAAQLFAAELNLSAGAETCNAVVTAVNNAKSVLVSAKFNGIVAYTKKGSLANQANTLAKTLDQYNNGLLCQ